MYSNGLYNKVNTNTYNAQISLNGTHLYDDDDDALNGDCSPFEDPVYDEDDCFVFESKSVRYE